MVYQATWADPFVTWNSLLYSWDGNHVDPESTEARLRQGSVFARITDQTPVARVETQRLHARVADGH